MVALHIARTMLKKNLGKTLLSIFGIGIGVAVIISILSISSGAKNIIESDLNYLGERVVVIRSGNPSPNDISLIEGFPFVENVSSRDGGITVKFREGEEVESSSTTLLHLVNRERVKDKYVLVPISNKYKVIERIRDNLALLVTIIGGLTLGMGGYLTAHQMVTRIRERVGHIGMLMAVGARKEDIYTIFGGELLIITLLGELLGILIGVVVSNIIGSITTITPLFNMWDIILTVAVSTLLTMGLGLVVIGSSLKFSVVEALKR